MSEQIKDFIAAVNGPRGCLDVWLESATESEVRDAIKAVMRAPNEQSLPAMTLRDYFAAKAMQGDWAAQSLATTGVFNLEGSDFALAAKTYYAMADALLAAREVKA